MLIVILALMIRTAQPTSVPIDQQVTSYQAVDSREPSSPQSKSRIGPLPTAPGKDLGPYPVYKKAQTAANNPDDASGVKTNTGKRKSKANANAKSKAEAGVRKVKKENKSKIEAGNVNVRLDPKSQLIKPSATVLLSMVIVMAKLACGPMAKLACGPITNQNWNAPEQLNTCARYKFDIGAANAGVAAAGEMLCTVRDSMSGGGGGEFLKLSHRSPLSNQSAWCSLPLTP
jgi:hypothetical protein